MGLEALLDRMESATTDTPVARCNTDGVTANPAPIKACTPVTPVTPESAKTEDDGGAADRSLPGSRPARHYRWWVILAGGERFEVRVLPEATADAMRELYQGATVHQAIPDGVE